MMSCVVQMLGRDGPLRLTRRAAKGGANVWMLAAIGLAAVTGARAQDGTLIVEHVGARDPISAEGGGWTAEPAHSRITPMALRAEGSGGLDAWQINDEGTDSLDYIRKLLPSDLKKLAKGFALFARLRVIDRADAIDAAIVVRFRDGQTSWFLRFGSTPNGDPTVELRGAGGPIALTGAGPGYHLYEVRDLDGDGMADFYVDGVLKRATWFGVADGRPAQVNWGSGSRAARGNAAYSLVRLVSARKRADVKRRRWNDMDLEEKSVFETKTIMFGKRRYCYVDEGNGDRTIVLIRGNRFCEKKWDQQIPALVQAGYRVISPYRAGTGGSDYVEFLSKATVAQDVYALLDCLGIQKIVVVGHCGGARIAWQMYLVRPSAIEAFINFDSGLFGKLKPREPYVERMDAETLAMYERNKEALAKLDRLWDYPSDYNASRLLRNKAWEHTFAVHARRTSLQPDERDLEPKRPHYCHVPVLSITCGRGRIRQDDAEAVAMERAYRKSAKSFRFVVITNCGHYPNQERPDVFNKAILDFLAETH